MGQSGTHQHHEYHSQVPLVGNMPDDRRLTTLDHDSVRLQRYRLVYPRVLMQEYTWYSYRSCAVYDGCTALSYHANGIMLTLLFVLMYDE